MIVVKYKDPTCRGSAGYYAKLCEPKWVDEMYVLCAHCNWQNVKDLEFCKALTNENARCKREARITGFCSHHQYSDEAEEARKWYKITRNITAAEMDYAISKLEHFVYVMSADGYVKIGHSVNPEMRLKAIKSESDNTLRPTKVNQANIKIIKMVKGGENLEQMLHSMCRQSHVIGEWFKHDSFVAEIIERLDENWGKNG